MVGSLKRVMVKRPQEAYVDEGRIDTQWEALGYPGRPDFGQAIEEHKKFVALLEAAGAEVDCLPEDDRTGLDSIYTHDPVASVTDHGVVLAHMGKEARLEEPHAIEELCKQHDMPILGRIEPPGMIEGGDVVWLNECLVTVGMTYRTNGEGIRQFQALMKPLEVDVIAVPMVHWEGPEAVLHLMSIISMLDKDLAVVYERLFPIPFRELLIALGIKTVPVPDEEYESLGCNVLAVAPRHGLIRSGNNRTVQRLREAGCRIEEFDGDNICYKGSGGPTCLTRPTLRQYTRNTLRLIIE